MEYAAVYAKHSILVPYRL